MEHKSNITIDVPVVYMGRDQMILMWAASTWMALEGWALKWPRAKRVPFGPKKVEIFCGGGGNALSFPLEPLDATFIRVKRKHAPCSPP